MRILIIHLLVPFIYDFNDRGLWIFIFEII